MAITTHTIDVGDAVIAYDVREAETSSDRPAAGPDRPADDGRGVHHPRLPLHRPDRRDLRPARAGPQHPQRRPSAPGPRGQRRRPARGRVRRRRGPVDVFGSSGGAVNALAWVARHPGDIHTLVAHEPPMLGVLPDAERAFAAERAVQERYDADGWGAGMAAFIAMTMVRGEFTDEFLAQPQPDPAAFGMPTEDDGSRDDPLLSGVAQRRHRVPARPSTRSRQRPPGSCSRPASSRRTRSPGAPRRRRPTCSANHWRSSPATTAGSSAASSASRESPRRSPAGSARCWTADGLTWKLVAIRA